MAVYTPIAKVTPYQPTCSQKTVHQNFPEVDTTAAIAKRVADSKLARAQRLKDLEFMIVYLEEFQLWGL